MPARNFHFVDSGCEGTCHRERAAAVAVKKETGSRECVLFRRCRHGRIILVSFFLTIVEEVGSIVREEHFVVCRLESFGKLAAEYICGIDHNGNLVGSSIVYRE